MNKITYWLRKTGMLRTSSYKVSGDAQKLNKVVASDGGMIQSQKDIDKQYEEKKSEKENVEQKNNQISGENDNQSKKKSKSKILFWIFLIIGVILAILMMLTSGFSGWFIIGLVLWGWFLRSIWMKTIFGTLVVWKGILICIGLIIVSFALIDLALPASEEVQKEHEKAMTQFEDKKQNEEKSVVKEDIKMDQISQFLTELKKGTEIDFGKITSDDNALWTSTNIALVPTNAKIMTVKSTSKKDWNEIETYFKDMNGHHGTIGFEFVDKSDDKQEGYLFDAGKYPHMMCIMTKTNKEIRVSCGWGPGGGN